MVIYYSQTGQSKRIAEMAAEKLHADLAEIKTVRSYDEDMWKADAQAKAERNAGKFPELEGALPEITSYDTVILGGPLWGQTISNPMLAYMRKTDFSDKTVLSFWTFYDHDENYNGDMKREAKGARVMDGLSLPRAITENPKKLRSALDRWIQGLQNHILFLMKRCKYGQIFLK